MIKFFRKIRYDLMENPTSTKATAGAKTGKYFKYAIGEIILVVIGILIALSINNWNEEKKSIRKGRDILIDIRENVKANIIQFQKDIDITKRVINSMDIILKNIKVTKVYNDSLDKHFRRLTYWETSRWKSSGYKSIISQGVEIIQSKELRESIIDLYEISYPGIAEYTRLSENNNSILLPIWLEFLEREPSNFKFFEHTSKPFDYQEIVESRMFRSMLTFLRSQRVADIQLRNKAIEKNEELIKLINNELK
jgi:Family of unknown function (DUF6090)